MDKERSPTSEEQAFAVFGGLPGVGKSISTDLWQLGMRTLEDIRQGDPEEMFEATKALAGGTMDRCVLYVYRCAVAVARNPQIDPELQKWWNWKDKSDKTVRQEDDNRPTSEEYRGGV